MSDENKDEVPGADGAAASGGDAPRGLTEAALYGEDGEDGEDGGGGDPDKGGKDKPKPKAGAGDPASSDDSAAAEEPESRWDKDRQQRDQAHAAEVRRMEGMIEKQGEQIAQLLDRLQAAPVPATKKGREARAALVQEVESLLEQDDPVAYRTGLVKVARAFAESDDHSEEAESLKGKLQQAEDRIAQLEAKFDGQSQDTAYARRKERQDTFLAGMDKDPAYGPDLRAPAIQLAIKAVAELGYTNENPAPLEVAILALKGGYRDARDAREAAKRKKGGKGVTLDSAAGGGGPAKGGRKTGSLDEVAERMVREGKLNR